MATGGTGQDINKYEYLAYKYKHLFNCDPREPFAMFGFECGEGWYTNLAQLLDHIDRYLTHKYKAVPEGFQIVQIKEKFGGLRFYVNGADDVIHELIRFTENLCDRTCEFCGSNQNIMRSKGWIITACKNCTETNEHLIKRIWTKIEI